MFIGLENFLIKPSAWNEDQSWRNVIPSDIQTELDAVQQPIGLGKHPEKGWFVMCAGQGPFVLWSEWEDT